MVLQQCRGNVCCAAQGLWRSPLCLVLASGDDPFPFGKDAEGSSLPPASLDAAACMEWPRCSSALQHPLTPSCQEGWLEPVCMQRGSGEDKDALYTPVPSSQSCLLCFRLLCACCCSNLLPSHCSSQAGAHCYGCLWGVGAGCGLVGTEWSVPGCHLV